MRIADISHLIFSISSSKECRLFTNFFFQHAPKTSQGFKLDDCNDHKPQLITRSPKTSRLTYRPELFHKNTGTIILCALIAHQTQTENMQWKFMKSKRIFCSPASYFSSLHNQREPCLSRIKCKFWVKKSIEY